MTMFLYVFYRTDHVGIGYYKCEQCYNEIRRVQNSRYFCL